MKIAVSVILLLYCHAVSLLSQNAPVITAGAFATDRSSVTVPVTALNFTNMGSCNLKLAYDPAIIRAISVSRGPLMAGDVTSNLAVPGVVTLGWYTWPGKTLPDNSVIFNIVFDKVANGSTSLVWLDDGNSCVWSDGNWIVLNDAPAIGYYINGSILISPVVPKIDVGIFASLLLNQMEIRILPNYSETGSNDLTDAGFTIKWPAGSGISELVSENPASPFLFVPLSLPVTVNGYYYQRWVLHRGNHAKWPANCEMVLQTFSFTGPPCPVFEITGDISLEIGGAKRAGILYHASAQQPVPEMPGRISGPAVLLSESTGQLYSIIPVSNAFTYTWTVPLGWKITAGEGTSSITVTAGLTGENGNITVTAGNSCGTSPSGFLYATVTARSTGISDIAIPDNYNLLNYPNPFATETTILFDLPESGEVTLKVMDGSGKEIAVLEKKEFNRGPNKILWSTPNLQAGVYFLKMFYRDEIAIRRISIIK